MRGFEPSISEDIGLWSLERNRADEGGSEAVVLIGSSRVKAGVNPEALAEATGWRRPVQLAIDFTSPLLILEDLAANERFRGLVIVDVAPVILFNGYWPQADPLAAGYLAHRASHRWSEGLGTRLSVLVESAFVFRLPELSGKHLLVAVRTGHWPADQRVRVDRHRVEHMNDAWGAGEAKIAGPKDAEVSPMTPARLNALIVRVNHALEQIRSHGGRAVFLLMPTAGVTADVEGRLLPRQLYWDVFAARMNAAAVNCHDYPELAGFVPPDGTHLKSSDAVAFSRALGAVLVKLLNERQEAPRQTAR